MRRPLRVVLISALLLSLQPAIVLAEPVSVSPDLFSSVPLEEILPTGWLIESGIDGNAECRELPAAEALRLRHQSSKGAVPLRAFHNAGPRTTSTGLRIILLGTPQLDEFPQAKEAFIRAAQAWESIILSPIEVTLEADFGPTAFGSEFDSDSTIGVTLSSLVGVAYPTFRSRLAGRPSSGREATLFPLLATNGVQSDIGFSNQIAAPGPVLEAVGIGSDDEPFSNPQIGFNSRFNFDTDRSNGISPGLVDFETVAIHEIGHALGFSSVVGQRELEAGFPVLGTALDLFRFRPGTTLGTIATAQRILSSGGEHRFFAGAPEIALSTGRTDGTGGDQQQAGHWKAASITGTRLGIMDPQVAAGTIANITSNDMLAFDTLGFVMASGSSPAAPGDVSADPLTDTEVTLSWTDNAADESGFHLYVAQGNSPFNRAGSTAANVTSIRLTGLLPGETFRFTVTAFNDSGESAFADFAETTLPGTPSATPAAPSELTATATGGGSQLTLSWRDNSGNEDGFNVYIADGNGDFELLGSTGPNVTGGTISGVEPGAFVRIQVTAFNAAGESDPSNIAQIGGPPSARRRPARR